MLCNSNRGRNICVLDLEKQLTDDQRMTSKYRESDSKACRSRHYNIDQWALCCSQSALCCSRGALMSHSDCSACAVPLH